MNGSTTSAPHLQAMLGTQLGFPGVIPGILIALGEEALELLGICLAIAALAGLYEWRRNGELSITFRGGRGETSRWAAADA